MSTMSRDFVHRDDGKIVRVVKIAIEIETEDGAVRVAEYLTRTKLIDLLTDDGTLGDLLRGLCEDEAHVAGSDPQ